MGLAQVSIRLGPAATSTLWAPPRGWSLPSLPGPQRARSPVPQEPATAPMSKGRGDLPTGMPVTT